MAIDVRALAKTLSAEQALVICQRLGPRFPLCQFMVEELAIAAARAMLALSVDASGNPVVRYDAMGRRLVASNETDRP